jgi:hypothetical protein
MNIVVTIQQDLHEKFEKSRELAIKKILENTSQQYAFYWQLNRRPAMVAKGNRVYFVWNKAVRAYCVIEDFSRLATDGENSKCAVMLNPDMRMIEPIDFPEFRGFRYFELPVTEMFPLDSRERELVTTFRENFAEAVVEAAEELILKDKREKE